MTNLIRFDWAIKRILRNKANHAVLEGLLSSLLGGKYTIVRFLESETNQENESDKFNRVDLLAEDEKGELFAFEIQNNRELHFFHRILYGSSKIISDYIKLGDEYLKVRKVYSINIVYFTIGQGKDYVYHGKTYFKGLHDPNDILKLSNRQSEVFFGDKLKKGEKTNREAGDVFPEYYLLCVNNFDKVAVTPIDEWMEFLKTGTIDNDSTAPGLADARRCLDVCKLSKEERWAYERHMMNLSYQKDVIATGYDDGLQKGLADGLKKGLAKGLEQGLEQGRTEGELKAKLDTARNLLQMGLSAAQVMQATGLTQEQMNLLEK